MTRRTNFFLAVVLFATGAASSGAGDGPAKKDAAGWSERFVRIADLAGIRTPRGITSASLGRREKGGEVEAAPGVRIVTRCGDLWCVDGLVVDGKELLSARLAADEHRILAAEGAWLERVVRVAWADEHVVSYYLASSWYAGGAHANNTLVCRTHRRGEQKALQLDTVLPRARACGLLGQVRALFDANTAVDVLGRSLDAGGFEIGPNDFRYGRTPGWHGSRPEVILCARGPYPSRSSEILELRLEALPVAYLLGSPSVP